MFELFSYPFIQRALIGGIIAAVLLGWVGVVTVLRRSSMAGDTIAHASLSGVAFGLLVGISPIVTAALVSIVVALGVPLIQRQGRLPIDSILGFILPFFIAIGVILLSLIPGYQPELMSFLFGSILSISWGDIIVVSIVATIVFIGLYLFRHELLLVSFDETQARVSGIRVDAINAIFGVILALTIVVGIKLMGIILLNALLVVPASTARLLSKSLHAMFALTPFIAILVVIVGTVVSFIVDLPTGPVMAVISGLFFLAALAKTSIRF